MKNTKSILALVIIGLLLANSSSSAQTVVAERSIAGEARGAGLTVQAEPPPFGGVALPPRGRAEAFAVAQAGQAIPEPPAPDAPDVFHLNVNPWASSAGSRALIITDEESSRETLSTLQEDMSVMARILDKSVRRNIKGEDSAWAMGIKIFSMGGQGSSRNFYLDGYGTVFVLSVPYPLVAPPKIDETERTKKNSDAVWEETKRELYGPKEDGFMKKFWTENKPAYDYDADRVEEIKKSVIGALKNAHNIRNLKPEESVVVVIVGPNNTRGVDEFVVETLEQDEYSDDSKPKQRRAPARVERRAKVTSGGRTLESGTRGETQVTIRAKKSDIDAFAEGKMELTEFQRKVKVTAY